jgi:hypothetical protein
LELSGTHAMVMAASGFAVGLMLYILARMAAMSERLVMEILSVVPGSTAKGGASGISGSTLVLCRALELLLPMVRSCEGYIRGQRGA